MTCDDKNRCKNINPTSLSISWPATTHLIWFCLWGRWKKAIDINMNVPIHLAKWAVENNNKLFSCLIQKCGRKGRQMRRCGQCQEVTYCSRDCQRGDRKAHKVTCRTIDVSASGSQPQLEQRGDSSTCLFVCRWDMLTVKNQVSDIGDSSSCGVSRTRSKQWFCCLFICSFMNKIEPFRSGTNTSPTKAHWNYVKTEQIMHI